MANIIDLDQEEIDGFKINESYAKKFEYNKKRQELEELSLKYQDEETGSSSSEIEDEDGELITPQVDAQIMKTITLLQKRSDEIYDSEKKYFDDEELERAKLKWQEKKTDKPIKLQDYQRSQLLGTNKNNVQTFEEEQNNLKEEFIAAIPDDDDQDLFTVRAVKEDPAEEESEKYSQYLLSQMFENEPEKQKWQDLKKNEKMDKDQEFLMDFVLHKGWVDKSKEKIPTYSELTLHDETDEEEDVKVDEFETQYNFRFEEGYDYFNFRGAEHIITHARNIPGTVRRKDNSRVLKRQAEKEKKQLQEIRKQEELKRLKALKREELAAKLQKIQEMAGGDLVGLKELDLSKDFDPADYDKTMNNMFTDEYYSGKEVKKSGKPKKPTWDDDIDISDLVTETKPTKKLPSPPKQDMENEQQEQENPNAAFVKSQMEKYLDEYYQMDYEDIVGGQPVRFKYRQVEPENYSLKPEEVLLADEEDLNKVVSLKKLGPYRAGAVKQRDEQKWKLTKKKRLWEFRSKLKGKKITNEADDEKLDYTSKKLRKEAKIDQSRLDSYQATQKSKKVSKK